MKVASTGRVRVYTYLYIYIYISYAYSAVVETGGAFNLVDVRVSKHSSNKERIWCHT